MIDDVWVALRVALVAASVGAPLWIRREMFGIVPPTTIASAKRQPDYASLLDASHVGSAAAPA